MVYVKSADCRLTLRDVLRIVNGELPLVYYHGTYINKSEIIDPFRGILKEHALVPRMKLEYIQKIAKLKEAAKGGISVREEFKKLQREKRVRYKEDIRCHKTIVKLIYENK